MATGNPGHNTNGWTEYQRLVLSELERHENKLNSLHTQLVELKIESSNIKVELANLSKLVKDLSDQLEETREKQFTNDLDVNKLKMSVRLMTTGISTVVSALAAALFKFFFH